MGRATNEPSNYICFGKQSSKDNEASTFYFLKHLDGSGFDTDPDIDSVREGGDGQEVGLRYKTLVKTDGNLVALSRPELAGRVLTGILGVDSVAAGPTTPLTDHTISPAATIPYHTLEQAWADERERTTNVKFNQVDIEFEAGKPLKFTTAFMSGGTSYRPTDATKTPVREAGPPLFFPGASVVITGAAGAALTKGKMSIKRNIDDGVQTTSVNREDLVELNQDYEFDGTIKYVDATLWRAAQYGGGTVVPVALATIGVDLFTAQGSQSLRLVQPCLHVTGLKVNRLDPDGKTMYMDLAAQSVKAATVPMFAVVRTTATAAY